MNVISSPEKEKENFNSSQNDKDLLQNIENNEKSHEESLRNKDVEHPLGTVGAVFHVIKGSMGSGILSIPVAFKNGGLWTSLVGTIVIGVLYAHCVHMVVYSSRVLCTRLKKPRLQYSEIAESAFRTGPVKCRPYTKFAKSCVDGGLILTHYSCCAVYVVFIASSVKQVVELNYDIQVDLRLYILLVTVLVLPVGMVDNLRYLVPFSFLSICALVFSLGFVLYEVFQDLPPLSSRPAFTSFEKLPYFFSAIIYSVDGIGVTLPIESSMRKPEQFLGCFGVLNISIFFLMVLYCSMGFFGYLRYGDDTAGTITLNISSSFIGKSVKLLVSLNVLCSYCLFLYVPCQIFWRKLKPKVQESRRTLYFYLMRVVLVTGSVLFAAFVPNLEAFVGLVGAVCDATLILFFPPIIELVTFWENDAYMGPCRWKVYKNLLILIIWLVTLVSGVQSSIVKIMALYS